MNKSVRAREQNDNLPTYFESINSLPLDDKKVEILTLELNHLPRRLDDVEFKKALFQNHHVIKLDTQKDNITGLCTGKGQVVIRCSDPEAQRNEIIEKLKSSGIQANYRSKKINEVPVAAVPVTERGGNHNTVEAFNAAYEKLMRGCHEFDYQSSKQNVSAAGAPSAYYSQALTDRFSASQRSNVGGNATPSTSSFHETFKQARSQITRTPNTYDKENMGKSPRFAGGEDTVKLHEMALQENSNNLYQTRPSFKQQ